MKTQKIFNELELKNIDLKDIKNGIKKSLKEIEEGKGINAKAALEKIHLEVFGEEV